MEKQQFGPESVTNSVSSDARAPRWVAPLQSFETFSVAEFTRFDASPGDDGNGPLTQS